MGKFGTSGNPIIIRVTDEKRMEEIAEICERTSYRAKCPMSMWKREKI